MIEENASCWLTNQCNHKDCDTFCLRRFKLDYLYNQALVSVEQRQRVDLKLDYDLTDKQAFDFLKNVESSIVGFVNAGKNLYLWSNMTGNGKTAWSLRLLQAYLNSVWPKSDLKCKALFINVPKFFLALKDNISEKSEYIAQIKANVLDADLVIWDEVALKTLTQFEMENLLSLINNRLDYGKSNIYTSNISPNDLLNLVGDRLYSRIINMSEVIEFKGADKRFLKK